MAATTPAADAAFRPAVLLKTVLDRRMPAPRCPLAARSRSSSHRPCCTATICATPAPTRRLAPRLPIEIISPSRNAYPLPSVHVPRIDKPVTLGPGVTILPEKAIQSTVRRAVGFFPHAVALRSSRPSA